MKKAASSCHVWALLIVSGASPAFSQAVNATLLGTVTDVTGASVAAAKVTVTETNTHVAHTTGTNASGNYEFPNLAPGIYSVAVEMQGFRREIREGVGVEVDTTSRVDVKLQPGSVTETIEVTGAPPLLQTDRADTGRNMDAVLVEELPLGVNRNFQSLLDLVPGTTPATFQHSQFFNASSSLQTEVNGQMRMGNNFQIEGIDNNQRTGLLQIMITPAEAIQTVSVSTSNHDPELGRASGAITNVIIKSGTNSFHGSAYEFTQNSAFDARSFFNPTVGHLVYNYVGGNLGGPIKRNKLFFFANFLRTMDHEANTNQETIPSMPFRSGDLSAGTNQVYDPVTGNPLDGTGRDPFPNNRIPASRINPVSAKILTFLPPPNESFTPSAPNNNYFALLPAQKTANSIDTKIDDNLTDKDRLSGRFSFTRPVTFQAPIFGNAGGPAQGAFEASGVQKTYSGGLNYNRIVTQHPAHRDPLRRSPLSQRGAASRLRNRRRHRHRRARSQPQSIHQRYGRHQHWRFFQPHGRVFRQPALGSALKPTSTSSTPGPKSPAITPIKWGVDLRRIRDDLLQDQTFSPRGVVTFGEAQTSTPGKSQGVANYFASFLLDVPSKAGRDVNTYFPALRAWQTFAYIADNWQVSPRLTLNIGLRWEFYKPPTPQFSGGFSNYNFADNTLVIAGIGGNPKDLGLHAQYKYFSPRLGLAYRVTGSTVIRSGFGISYTPYPDNTYAYNFPVRANNSYQPLNSYAPAVYPDGVTTVTFQNGFPPPRLAVIPANGIIANPDPTSTYYDIPLDWKNPYVETWNFAVQQALPGHFVLDAAYVGSHGVDTPAQVNLNAGRIPGLGAKGQPQYPRTSDSLQFFQGFSCTYNALQVKFDRRYTSGLRLTTSFTWGKGLTYQKGDDSTLVFYSDERRNYARADFDRTLNFIQSYIYELPFGRTKRWLQGGPAAKVFGGWQVSGILSARTGTPLLFTAGGSLNLPSTTQTPDQVAPIQILHGIGAGNPWFSKSSFATPVGVKFGTLGRNEISGPGLFSLNASISRSMALTERLTLSLRGEAFNLSNTPQFANPNVSLTSSSFSYVISTLSSGTGVNGTGGGRAIQAGVKVIF